ncbi:hypothetical protein GLAREA_10533 [Glarea lozoyensis ATCC 20868]|uniref:DUF8021 domain-containing protein n=1 Tax=Glarea lozoyensis (strain ATCC 20868 / MF5171) TaxID=1116229 RepID=S3E991_GLAL2|nr:uncharacterized protein GLAREA_10533 [Glarea lozoyensis ATCC 20868]EPE34838.1 hypothetical protein GLAREA_10533 [Glarea lozoyensis ATCC 20868]
MIQLKTTLLALLSISQTTAECTRDSLLLAAQTYISTQTTGTLSTLALSQNFTYRENNKIIDLKKGILVSPLKITFNRSTADTTACASYTNLIVLTPKPYVISTQIRHDSGTGISMIDSIVATTKDLFFNATLTQSYLRAENWGVQTAPVNRDLLKRVGDAYLDMWTDAKAADSIPWGTDCERVEGSKLTRPCGGQLPHGGSTKPNGMRRYVIDELVGSVDVLCAFDSLGNMPDSHEIRVEGGKVKYVHTVTVLA